MEIVVHEQLSEYLEKNNILYEGQSGFRSDHSCESACQFVLCRWKKDMDRGDITVSVFVDLKRAFETIDREKLITTCEVYGVKATALKWFKSYLSGRYRTTKFLIKLMLFMESPKEVCWVLCSSSYISMILKFTFQTASYIYMQMMPFCLYQEIIS